MKIKKKLKDNIDKKRTLLGIGPMSKNCIDASIELSDKYFLPLMLIASRRQIDFQEIGGGYVENWSTCQFSKYVQKKSKKKQIILCRDHGGPWQNNLEIEKNYNIKQAMDSAKKSYMEDIKNNFKVIHIDPSIPPKKNMIISTKDILDRAFELMEFCYEYSQKINKEIVFEIGTEEQSGSTNSFEEIEFYLNKIKIFCTKNKIPFPCFIVIQSGTKVIETENVGSFESPIRIKKEIAPEIQIFKALELCEKYGVWMKEHNADYLSNDSLKWHPRIGIHAVNVAPEFGITETRTLIDILKKSNLNKELSSFYEISYKSGKWKKWMKKNTTKSDKEKAIISGHYVFSKPEFIELKKHVKLKLKKKNIDLDRKLRDSIKYNIMRYLKNFRLVGNE